MSMFRTTLTAVVITLPLPALAQQPDAMTAPVDAIFAQWDSTGSAGCAVGVARDGRTVLARAYGMADLEHGIRNTPATIFESGSLAKQFTAAAIALLALDGKLSLDDDVRRYVSELPDYGQTITIRHLLTHTSGLRDWGSVAAIAGWGRDVRTHTHDHVLDILSRQRTLNFTPGTEYSYSNSGYNLLAIIVDRVSGMPFAEFSRTRIFEPLGLENTQWRDDYRRIVPGRSSAYAMRGGTWVIDRPIENVHGNGGLLTTIEDLLTWNEALATGTLGGPAFVQMMHQRGVLNNGRSIDYAAGLFVTSLDDVPEVSHTGSTAGYRAFLARYPDQHLDVAVLCNAGNVNPGRVGRDVARIALDRPSSVVRTAAPAPSSPGAAPRPPALTAEMLQAYAGEYYSPDAETTLAVTVDGASLVIQRRPAARMPLRALEEDLFTAGQLGRVRFIRDDTGTVTHLSVQQARVYDLRFERVQ
ncbi:MAG TPA: serine hydrolase domain-containing protein [Longimicrobiales bacterium]|nr:serine hydrolase domain-containing protein [Longimicrobiales bacterium]